MLPYKVFSQPLGEYGTNAYLLVSGQKAIAFDAPPGSCRFYQSLLEQYNLSLNYLLLTHSHFDHISEAKKIQNLGVKVGVHKADAPNCRVPGSDGLPLMMPVGPFEPDFIFESQPLHLEGIDIKIIHTPGHSPGGVCFIIEHMLFSGDTLFKGAIGNISFPLSDILKMKESLKALAALKENYTIYPGHGPKTQLDHERNFIIKTLQHIG